MNRTWRCMALCAAVLVTQIAAAQAPEEHTFVVLDLKSPPVMRNIARRLSADIAWEAQQLGAKVIDARELIDRIGSQRVGEAEACGTDAACVAGALAGVEADRIISGTLDRSDEHYRVRLVNVDLTTAQVVSRLDRDVLIASRRLDKDVLEGVPDLLKGEPEKMGTLVVVTEVEGAEVLVDGEPVGRTPDLEVQVQPGKHEITVRAEDYLEVKRFVEIRPEETTEFEARLLLEPGKEKPGVVAAATATPGEPEPAFELPVPVTSLIAGGVSLLALGGGITFGLQASDIESEAIDDDEDGLLDITRARALEGRNAATAANALYGLAGAAAIGAVVLAILDGGAEPPAPDATEAPAGDAPETTTTPEVTAAPIPGGAAVFVGGRF